MNTVDQHTVSFDDLVAVEFVETRAFLVRWSDSLYADQLKTWVANKEADRKNKDQAPTLEQCREKSRQIRRKREVDETYFNQLTARKPLY